MAGGAKMTALAGEGKMELVGAVFARHPGKAIGSIAAIKIPEG